MVVSHRPTFRTMSPPVHKNNRKSQRSVPHCPGVTHELPVSANAAMIPRLDGLKKCLPRNRKTALLAIAIALARASGHKELARNKRHKLIPVIAALFIESLLITHCTAK